MNPCFRLSRAILVVGLSALSGCVMWMRDADFYSAELTELLETHDEVIEACYDRYLAEHDPKAAGQVVVAFDVTKRTGELTNITLDDQQSTAPEPLAACVTDQIAQMPLDPPDAKPAHAQITWVFAPGSRKRPPADPFKAVESSLLTCYETHLRDVDRDATGELVVEYAFNPDTGALEQLDVVEAGTTAPGPVVACATEALSSAWLDPKLLDQRNTAGRREFTLRYTPWQPPPP
ncbi:hypothetical protein [Enhygromyxa salina]|nr:hypothetical protein [Enhygromyxa salina]